MREKIRLMFAVMVGFWPMLASAQSPILLNINSSTYPTLCTVANYQALGVHGLSGGESISQYSPAFNAGLASPVNFSGGQVMYMGDTSNGGTWVKSTGGGTTNGLMDCYFYTTTATPRTLTVSNLNLTPSASYTLYLIGTIPVDNGAEEGRFQPVNTANITFASSVASQGAVGFPFTTSASYSSTDTLKFTWAKASTGNGSFQGLAIVPGAPTPTANMTITNGVQKYTTLASTTVTMSGRCELWVTSAAAPITGNLINLTSADAWLFLPNVKPSIAVQPTYLGQVRINGATAVANSNCRVVQYGAKGSIVIPHSLTFQPLTVYTGAGFTGTATSRSQWTYYTGSGIANISSFRLKRGYQAVFAQSANGVSSSRCYVAQDGDLEIGALPATLDKQVQFIYVTPWRWVSKKGSCDIAPTELDAQWWYNWNISASSTRDMEYVAIRQQPYWPGLNQNWQSLQVNHVSGYNEPNNPVEDAYKNLNPQGSVSDAVARLPDQLVTGLRVGTPAVTDGGYSWIVDFVNQANAAGYRMDYVPIHYYRSYGNNAYTQGAVDNLYNFLKGIHDAVKRPIWLTEFNNGANWTTDADPTFAQNKDIIEGMINMMDSTPWIERYSVYSAVEEVRQVYYNAGGYTPMGLMYRDHVAPLSHVQAIPDNGMRGIAQYLFTTNTLDTSGYYNNAVAASAPVYAAGHAGGSQAIVLDGANNHVVLPANIANGNAFTFAAWVNWSGVGGSWQRIFDFGNDTTQYMFLTPSSTSSKLRFAITVNGYANEQAVETTALPPGQWRHVAVTLNGNNCILYVNGVQVASSTSFSIAPSAFSPVNNYLGKSQFSDPLFNGKLEGVVITDYAMSPTQVAALTNLESNPPTSPTGLAAIPGNNQVGLTWDFSPGATNYNVKRSTTNGGPYSTIASPATISYTDTTAVNGTTYYYVVSAVNGGGQSANSSQVSISPFQPVKLTGAVIGTAGSYGGSGNTIAKVFDNNLGTYYDATNASGDWAGLDLGTARVIKMAKYCPRASWAGRMVGGVFQGANVADFSSGVVTLFTVTAAPSEGVLTAQPISDSGSYRYVRYKGPTDAYCNVAEVEFYEAGIVYPPASPTGLGATPGDNQVGLTWNTSSGAASYNVKRSTTNSGPYSVISSPATTSYTDVTVVNGTMYYYVVSAVNVAGESANSSQINAQPVSTVPPSVQVGMTNNEIHIDWPTSHIGWRLQVQTNTLSTNGWYTVPGASTTNDMALPIGDTIPANVFYRLVYP